MAELMPERAQAGALLSGRYRLERVVGSGGMAVVWRARDESLERPVAVKVMSDALSLNPAYVSRFAREARIAARISHPNLVEIYDYSTTAVQPYLVMQYVDGGTLDAKLGEGHLPADQVRELACDLLSALTAVHAEGVLHRDIKPANVLLGRDGHARLTDFGVARLEEASALTQPGHVVGTLRYLAPELTLGTGPSAQSDLFALGILLDDAAGSAVGPLGELITWLSAPTPEERPASAADALERVRSISTAPLTNPSATGAPPPRLSGDTTGVAALPPQPSGEPTLLLPLTADPTEARTQAPHPRAGPHPSAEARPRAEAYPPAGPIPPRRGRARILALLLCAAVLAVAAIAAVVLRSAGNSSTHAAGPPSVPRGLSLDQRLSRLDAAVRSAPGP